MNPRCVWWLLVMSLPTRNATARMRVWRALKSLGCAVLRDGAYLLPDRGSARQALEQQQDEVIKAGGAAHLLPVQSLDPAQEQALQRLFDRTAEYAQLTRKLAAFKARLGNLAFPATEQALRKLRREFEAISALDYFPGPARAQAERALSEAEEAARARLFPGEPHPVRSGIKRLDKARYQGRVWATRKRPWVDRLASAWLIARFIDPKASFLWLEKPADCPRRVLGFDFDGATFTHVGARVTFEVLLASFGLEGDPALARIGALVRYLDVGGIPVPEAPGLEAILRGAQAQAADDDALLAQAQQIFDSLYCAYSQEPSA